MTITLRKRVQPTVDSLAIPIYYSICFGNKCERLEQMMILHKQFDKYLDRRSKREALTLVLLTDVPFLIAVIIGFVIARVHFTLEYLDYSVWGQGLYASGAPVHIVRQCVQEVHGAVCTEFLNFCILFVVFVLFVLNVILRLLPNRLERIVIRRFIKDEYEASTYRQIVDQSYPYEVLVCLVLLGLAIVYSVLCLLQDVDPVALFSRQHAVLVIGLTFFAVALAYVFIDKRFGLIYLASKGILQPGCFHKLLLLRSLPILFLSVSFYASLHLAGIFFDVSSRYFLPRIRNAVTTSEATLLDNAPKSSESVRAALQLHLERSSMALQIDDMEEVAEAAGSLWRGLTCVVLIIVPVVGFATTLLPMASTVVMRPGIFVAVLFISVLTTGWVLDVILPPAFRLQKGSLPTFLAVMSLGFTIAFVTQYLVECLIMKRQLCPRCSRKPDPADRYCAHCGLNLELALRTKTSYIGSVRTKQVHAGKCKFARKIETRNVVVFDSLREAYRKGFDNCAHCLGASQYKEKGNVDY